MSARNPRRAGAARAGLALLWLVPAADAGLAADPGPAARAASAEAPAADPIRFARYPHASHGMIAFSYHGDIWVAQEDGSDARRLTAHVARDVFPRFSPDGRWIAFSSDRMGNNDVYVVPATGGEPRQLTYHGADDNVLYWTPDGAGIVFATSRGTFPFGSPLHIVPVDGGLPVPMEMDVARAGMISQDGSMVAFNRLGFTYWRKGYRGHNSTDVWVQDVAGKEIRQLTDTDLQRFREFTHDAFPMWGADGMIYFVSERSGTFNIWRIPPAGGEPAQVTFHTDDGVQYPSISPDGSTIAYENEFDLWLLRVPDGEPRRLRIELAFDPKDNLVEFVTTENRADEFSPSPSGDDVAVEVRGELFTVPADAAVGEKARLTRSPWRDRSPVWSPDGRRIAYLSDESGEEEVWVYEVGTGERRRLGTHESFKSPPVWAPDGSRLAFTGANRLFEADVRSGTVRELGYNEAGGYNLAEYAPGGRWLVYTRRDEEQNFEVYLFDIEAGREHNVSRNPFRDTGGTLTPDGRTLVFASRRDGGTNHLFAVSLVRLAEDPDDPLVRARLRSERPDSAARGAARDARPAVGARGGDAAADVAIRVDADGIERRAVQLTRGENGAGSYFLSRDGRTVYFTGRDDDGPGLFSIGIDGRDRRKVASGSFPDLTPTEDRRTVFYSQRSPAGAEIHRMPLSNQRKERVDFTFTVEVDRRAEWEQIFEESWRVMKYRFYDERMHGVDWAAVKAVYRPLLPSIGTYEDLYDLANEMIGELNASHTGVRGPPSRPMPQAYRTRFLGFELEPADGRYRISHLYRDGPADKEWLDLKVGDYVLAIDGVELRAGDNYWKALNHTLNEYVPVRVARDAAGAGAREVRIRAVNSLNNVRYEEWVARNREFVERESDGQIAYVHIRAMNQPSLARFQNEIDRYWNRKGIVVDIRYNGGGNIDQQLIDILERRPYQYWNNRWGARTWGRRPRQAIAGPKVMLINWRSGSDSEVTPMGFRQLGLGRIVGNPTAGAVIATGSYRLINGATIRTPGSLVITYDPTQPNNFGINLENYGVAPDVWVKNSPADEINGYDRELKAAVDEALRMLRDGRWQYTEH